ncbi:DMT family transporter [Pseudorhodoplanes sp.]|uniref:DMT family transporter n=1 Tax=Pseudorhodoplanes sp. TaxID=1934341 RepID=UPI002C79783E|nr:DMT family transporter [Pseudorhodoplanes sp.]HWV54387.1 DMT family transporter [Pseudorhodoplanes sp.]
MTSMAAKSATREEWRVGIALVLLSTIAFAIGPIAAKIALDNGSNVLTVVTLRGVIGATLLAVLVVVFRQHFRISRAALRWCLACGVFSAVMVYGFIGAVAYIPVSVAVLIFFVHPILIAVIAHWRGGERLTGGKLLLALGALAGLALALAPTFDTLGMTGVALAALAAVTICGSILCAAQAQRYATSTQVNLYVTGLAGASFAVITSLLDAWSLPSNTLGWLGIVGAGVGIAVGLLCFFASFRYLSPVRATMLSNVEPLLSILFAAVILGQWLSPIQWLGAAMMIGAIALFEAAGRRDRSDESDPASRDGR